jgi:hypothetical protein
MSIIGGVGTAYSSFFNFIRMGWNQYKKNHFKYTQIYSVNLKIQNKLLFYHIIFNTKHSRQL